MALQNISNQKQISIFTSRYSTINFHKYNHTYSILIPQHSQNTPISPLATQIPIIFDIALNQLQKYNNRVHTSAYYKQLLYKFKNYSSGMWIVNWFKSTLEGLGLKNKNAKIVFLGLDDAGKTTLLLRLKEDVMKQMDPTQQPYSQQLVLGNIRFKAWDLGGHEAARKTWRNYVSDVDGIIYLVDSSNHKRFQESRNELQGVLEMPELEKVPIVILGNKIDKGGAVSQQELRQQLGLQQKGAVNWSQNKSLRPIQVFMCSVAKKMGYADGFKWLSNYLK